MARPREFDESAVLDAAVLCFWKQGYEATSVRDLVEHTGIAAASLYNAFGDKRALYEKALDHYVEDSIADRIRRCKSLPPLRAIEAFFEEIVKRSLDDRARKGCMLVNAALDVAARMTQHFGKSSRRLSSASRGSFKRASGQARPTVRSRGRFRRGPWRKIFLVC